VGEGAGGLSMYLIADDAKQGALRLRVHGHGRRSPASPAPDRGMWSQRPNMPEAAAAPPLHQRSTADLAGHALELLKQSRGQ